MQLPDLDEIAHRLARAFGVKDPTSAQISDAHLILSDTISRVDKVLYAALNPKQRRDFHVAKAKGAREFEAWPD